MEVTAATSADALRNDYMKLLVAQLQHQDPMEPMKNEDLSMQLATMSQLEQMENLNVQFGQMLRSQELTEANDLVGQQISFFPSSSEELYTGVATEAKMEDGNVCLQVGAHTITLDKIISVKPA